MNNNNLEKEWSSSSGSKEILSIVKIGGNVVDNDAALDNFLTAFHRLPGKKLLVHGGGVAASRLLTKLGIQPVMLQGRRITDADTLKVVTMVYAGWINKHIVSLLQKNGCNAIGLSGADANIIPSIRRSPDPIDYGFVGDPNPKEVGVGVLEQLMKNNLTPVVCAITHDGGGTLLNTNADTISYTLATALSSIFTVKLFYCFDKAGVLTDINDSNSLIQSINKKEYETLRSSGVITDGMIPKMDNSFKAIDQGVSEVIILNADNLLSGKGTRLSKI